MNERIVKLYDRAIVIEDAGDYVCGELDIEKFAELIINECCVSMRPMLRGMISRSHAIHLIKEHFGVKE